MCGTLQQLWRDTTLLQCAYTPSITASCVLCSTYRNCGDIVYRKYIVCAVWQACLRTRCCLNGTLYKAVVPKLFWSINHFHYVSRPGGLPPAGIYTNLLMCRTSRSCSRISRPWTAGHYFGNHCDSWYHSCAFYSLVVSPPCMELANFQVEDRGASCPAWFWENQWHTFHVLVMLFPSLVASPTITVKPG